MPWDPACYERFRQERYAPFEDALALVRPKPHMQVVDLGCGTGELTARLFQALPQAIVTGVDSSAEMLVKTTPWEQPHLNFRLGDLSQITGEWDLIFSHAAIQWVDDHPQLISFLFHHLRPGGQLVLQMPSNHGHISHRLIQQVASTEPFATALQGWQRQSPVLPVGRYAALLYQCGGLDLVVYEKVYPHVLPDAQAIVEWVKGTALVPYLERLPSELQEAFLTLFHTQLHKHLPQSPVFYGFQRILLAANKPC